MRNAYFNILKLLGYTLTFYKNSLQPIHKWVGNKWFVGITV